MFAVSIMDNWIEDNGFVYRLILIPLSGICYHKYTSYAKVIVHSYFPYIILYLDHVLYHENTAIWKWCWVHVYWPEICACQNDI